MHRRMSPLVHPAGPAASAQGICAAHIIAGQQPPINLNAVPGCIYTDPEIASVGITEDEAKAQGIPVKKGKYLMTGNGRSIIDDRAAYKVIVMLKPTSSLVS